MKEKKFLLLIEKHNKSRNNSGYLFVLIIKIVYLYLLQIITSTYEEYTTFYLELLFRGLP